MSVSRTSTRGVRAVLRMGITLTLTIVGLVTSVIFAMWLTRTLSPRGDWLNNTLTAFGYPIAWLLLTLLYISVITAIVDWFFRLFWPKPAEVDHEE